MIIAAIYPVAVWFLVFKHRRTWRGYAIAAAGTLLLWPIALLVRLSGAIAIDVYSWLVYAEMALIGAVSFWIATMPITAGDEVCPCCKYDLSGIDAERPGARCPECGAQITPPTAAPGQPCCLSCGQRLTQLQPNDHDPRCPRCNASQDQFANWKRADTLRQQRKKPLTPG